MSSDLHSEFPAAGEMREVLLPGPVGRLEALIAAPRTPRSPAGFCVVCHPHPLFGGAMTNKVAYTLASSALQAGLVAVRFNFRGVGRSEGQYSDARGETDDVLAVVEWMRARMPGAPVALAGFSFGAYVSLKAAATVHPVLQISVSVPFGRYVDSAPPPPRPDCPWLALHSRDDEVVSYEETAAVLRTYSPPPEQVTFEGAGHFYHGRLGDVREAVLPFIERHWPTA
jgi:alpha/beta superfamily hydrolase